MEYESAISLDELKLRIVDALETVTLQMLENSWRKIEYRLSILRAKKEAYVEINSILRTDSINKKIVSHIFIFFEQLYLFFLI
jgi:hypothetical protein